ncbi:four-carbon acid sugar kinase family protein [Rhodovarius crocodyli]|uniref:Four-carbon acid sugar kinase family protein n=1 Tax=Rhodovarius crocodyli TaxID=1979269 RepID=A0A437MGA1_9PROT|nr:four-carbon acid sugar kinase family protein [Rhodovarius crocodyli]RVT96671.1 four-carbon acid sugar kinase family protein [Rhodovarius crocodyli]
MTRRWLILADDLTGAADCGIAFAKRGLAATVGWGNGADAPGAAVLVIDADSRRLSAEAAGIRHRTLLEAHHAPGTLLIKKIDSTLRGQPAQELADTARALRARGAGSLAILAPAFPATGRTTEGGCVLINGAPLESTPLWARDHTYESADLVEVMAGVGMQARLVPVETVRDPQAFGAAIRAALAEGADALVCDAVVPADLGAIATATLPFAEQVFWIGSGGIAAALAGCLPQAAQPCLPPAGQGGVLMVVGSVAEASRAAARKLIATGEVHHVVVQPESLLAGPPPEEAARISADIAGPLSRGQDVLVEIAADADADLSVGAALATALARLLAPAAPHLSGLFATGGETACALLSELGIHGIDLVDEIEPGVPLGITRGAFAFPVMTKAGAFGGPDTIQHARTRLRAMHHAGAK